MAFTYSDIDPLFGENPLTGDLSVVTDNQAIINSCQNLVITKLLSRPFQPDIGSGIESDLFELSNATSAENIAIKIQNVIKTYEPRVESVSCNVIPTADGYGYTANVILFPKNSLQPITFQQFLKRVL